MGSIKHIIISIILFLLLFIPYNQSQAQDIITTKAAYMERFTRFIEWPDSILNKNSDQKFTVLILGKNPFEDALEKLYSTTKIKGRKVEVIYSNNVKAIVGCNMVYVSSSCKKNLEEIVKYTRENSVLSIGDTEGYARQGIMINFFIDEDVLRFELNRNQLENSNLKVSHLLLKVAKTDM